MNKSEKYRLSVTVSTLEQLKKIRRDLFDMVIAGNPFCHRIPGNASSPENILQTINTVKEYADNTAVAMPVAPMERDIPALRRMLSEISEIRGLHVEVQSHSQAWMIKVEFPEIPVIFGPWALTYTDLCIREMDELNVKGGTLPYELEGVEIAQINKDTSIEIFLPIFGQFPVSFSQVCHFYPENPHMASCRYECLNGRILEFDDAGKVLQKGRAIYSHKCLNMGEQIVQLKNAGFRFFRLEGLIWDGEKVNRAGELLNELLNTNAEKETISRLNELAPEGYCNGFFFGTKGADYIDEISGREYFERIGQIIT